ncbi:type II and III secretion system protein family protein [Roseibium litorale]|uniref:Type II and III secretion system protein family protein n=1 Tax=Roseibium litorale TaxID=2803841 RepID=A0ABR9CN72_9HYPH|nr:type II and III secretion system protein family protein [Roseibium litorale]MBD8892324.1 type II and III secretion system protein family protein [Roseibium litorale]
MIEVFQKAILAGGRRFQLIAVLLAFSACTVFQPKAAAFADASFPKQIHIASGERTQGRMLRVGVGRSVVIDLAEPVADVLVSNPAIADAVVKTQNRVFVLGNKLGQANLVLFASSGRELASFNLRVEADSSDLESLIKRLLPRTRIAVETLNGSVILTGSAASAADAQAAGDIASRFMGTGGAPESGTPSVLNMIAVDEKDQVHLKVTVAEVERSIIKRLGVEMGGSVGIGNYTAGFNMPASYNVNSNVVSQASLAGTFVAGNTSLAANIEALQRDGVIRTLAEPTLTAISGENANFLAGGEFPIPVGYDNDSNKVTIEFKKFGVGLDFTPVVLSGGRISLKIKTEVSELTTDGAVQLSSITIPALKVRRAESTLELPSGGTLVMAGLLKESYKQSINGVPGLMQLPVLGSLFKSRDFLRQQTELVVFVTPYVVAPVAASQIQRPDQNLMLASDAETVFLNRLNKIFRPSIDVAPQESYHGQVGFIYK